MKKFGVIMLSMILTLALLAGCQSGNDKQVVLQVGERDIYVGELNVYLTELENMYEQQYGATIWDLGFEGQTIQDIVKNAAMSAATRLNVIALYAQDQGITLDDTTKADLDARAQEYFATFDEATATADAITLDTLKKVFYDNALSDKVMEAELADFVVDQALLDEQLAADAEYQDLKTLGYDEYLKQVRARHILISTMDEAGTAVDEATKEGIKATAIEVMAKAKALESLGREEATAGFIALVEEYSQDPGSLESGGEYTFGRGQMIPAFEDAAFSMEPGQISDIVETDYGYHIILLEEVIEGTEEDVASLKDYEDYIISNYEYTQKQEAFDALYLTWEPNYTVTVNEDVWAEVEAKQGTAATNDALDAVTDAVEGAVEDGTNTTTE